MPIPHPGVDSLATNACDMTLGDLEQDREGLDEVPQVCASTLLCLAFAFAVVKPRGKISVANCQHSIETARLNCHCTPRRMISASRLFPDPAHLQGHPPIPLAHDV